MINNAKSYSEIFVICFSVVVIFVAILISLNACSNTRGQKSDSDLTTNIQTSLQQEYNVLNTTNNATKDSNTNLSNEDINLNVKDFEYKLKNAYTSRSELLQEKADLQAYYKKFIDKKDSSVQMKAKQKMDELMLIIEKDLLSFPPSNDEILREKEKLLKEKIVFKQDFFRDASDELSAFPNNPTYIENYQKRKAEYEKAQNIEKKYNEGVITIDKALELLGINYTE